MEENGGKMEGKAEILWKWQTGSSSVGIEMLHIQLEFKDKPYSRVVQMIYFANLTALRTLCVASKITTVLLRKLLCQQLFVLLVETTSA
jgi:hypothetical protein